MRIAFAVLLTSLTAASVAFGDVPASATRDLLPKAESADRMQRRNPPPCTWDMERQLLRRLEQQERQLENLRDTLDRLKKASPASRRGRDID